MDAWPRKPSSLPPTPASERCPHDDESNAALPTPHHIPPTPPRLDGSSNEPRDYLPTRLPDDFVKWILKHLTVRQFCSIMF